MWKLALLCMGCSLLVQHLDALEAVVFVKASYTKGMIEAIKNVNGVTNVYYTKPLFIFTGDEKGNEVKDEWNYVVLGKDLKDVAAQDKLISEVGNLTFVKNYAGYRLRTLPNQNADALNTIMKNADPAHFVKRPMKPATPKPDCSYIHLAKGERLKMIQLNRSGDKKMLEKMGHEWLLTVFPALKGSYDYVGGVDASQCSGIPIVWDGFGVTDFVDVDTFCEYTQSQWVKDIQVKYPGVFKGLGIGIGVEV